VEDGTSLSYLERVMKKSTSLLFAIVSTLFLAVGAARAAEKFDGHAGKDGSLSGTVMDGPGMPCLNPPDDN
jgi:hypothetical protein